MGSPLRVLHAVVNMNRGGAETFIMNLYRNIDRSRVQFDFLTCKPGVFDDEIRELGGVIHRIPYISEVGHFGYKRELEAFFAKHSSYRIVHSHMDRMSGLVLQAARRQQIPMRIAHSHNTQSEGSAAAKMYKWYAGTSINSSATHYAACSGAAAKWMFGNKAKASVTWQNGIECDRFAFNAGIRLAVRAELGIGERTFVIGHVGRFAPQKNHKELLDIFAEYEKSHPDTILLLAGDGPLRPAIEEQIQALQLSGKVRLLGIQANVERYLQAFDAILFPSLHEGLPVTLIEAQGAGLPCIISDAITAEVDLGLGLVHRYPLGERAPYVNKLSEIASTMPTDRAIPDGSLAAKGYDIRFTAKRLEDYYLSPFEVNDEPADRIYSNL